MPVATNMSGILWIYKLSVVLVLIQWQSMNAYAGPGTWKKRECSGKQVPSLCGYTCTCPFKISLMQDKAVPCDLSAPGVDKPIELSCTNTNELQVLTCGCRNNSGVGQGETVNITCKKYGTRSENLIKCIKVAPSSTQRPSSIKVAPSSTQRPSSIQGAPNSTQRLSSIQVAPSSTQRPSSIQGAPNSTQRLSSIKVAPSSTQRPSSIQGAPNSTQRLSNGTPSSKKNLKIIIAAVLGILLLLTLIASAIYRSRVITESRALAQNQSFDTAENMGHDNLAYRQPRSLPDDELEMVTVSPQSDVGFSKSRIYPGGHCQTLDNENGRPDNLYPDPVDSEGATGTHSEIENELSAPDSPNCSDEPLFNLSPTSLPESTRKLETTFFSSGGEFFAQGSSNWERVPNESKRVSQSQAVNTFSFKDIFSRGRPRIKRATVFASRPDPKSDLIYLRFYVYSYNEDSRRCLELAEKERFPDSRPAREKPFRMYKANRVITVKFTHLEDGWKFINTDDTQIYKYEKARSGCQFIDACDFAVKPEDGRDLNSFSCWVKFQQEDVDEVHWLYLNPGFTPLKRQSIRRSGQSNKGGQSNTSTSTAQYEGSVHWDHCLSSLGSEPVTEEHIYQISPDVGRNWKDLLRNLSIKEKTIENLSVDFMHEKITEQCIQGLMKWKERDPQLATIKTLAIALRNVDCFDALLTLQKLR